MLCAIWFHIFNLKNVKNTPKGVLHLVKFWAEAWNFTRSVTPPWVLSMLFKLLKWYKIAQSVSFDKKLHSNAWEHFLW